jgi:acetyl-CoA carboxylase carboxyl transferase subunit alpha
MANVGDVLAEELKGFDGLTPQQIKKRRADRFYAIGAL